MIRLLILALVIAGCSISRECGAGGPPEPTPCSELSDLGRTLIWVGGIAVVVGVAARFALAFSFLNPLAALLSRLPGVSGIATGIAELGAVSVACGLAFAWLGQNPWLMVAASAAALVAWGWYRRAVLLRWVSRWSPPQEKPK